MAKKKAPGVPNRPMYSRISFLYQAATYLAASDTQTQTQSTQKFPLTEGATVDVDMDVNDNINSDIADSQSNKPTPGARNMSRRLLSQLRATTLKSQIRVNPEIKRSICKYCDTLLIEGQTCSSIVENKSKGGKKPWADTLVVKCQTCGREKRFPVNTPKQKRRPLRDSAKSEAADQKSGLPTQPQEESVP